MNDYLFDDDRLLLQRHGLARFDALWDVFLRKVGVLNQSCQDDFLSKYLQVSQSSGTMTMWQKRVGQRRAYKEQCH